MNLMLFDSTYILAFFASLTFRVVALDDARPEVFLPPRNFNPHPYQNGYQSRVSPYLEQEYQPLVTNNLDAYQQPEYRISGIYFNPNTGPVLFPANPEEPVVTSKPVVDRLKEIHPYAAVVKKKKYKQSQIGGFSNEKDPNRINSVAYRALVNQGAKVLSLPHQLVTGQLPGPHDSDVTLADQKKDYEFSYKVENHATGDDFSHIQSQNSHATNGEYRVRLPDGRVQVVSYMADHNGYNAEVTYEEDKGGDGPAQSHEQVVLQAAQVGNGQFGKLVQHKPVSTRKINVLAPDYDYQLYDQPSQAQRNNIPLYEDTYPVSSPVYRQQQQQQQQHVPLKHATSHASYYRTQEPVGIRSSYKHHGAQVAAPPRVQIYATGLVGSTAAPQVHGNGGGGYRSNVVYSTAAPQAHENVVFSTVAPSANVPIYLSRNVGYSTVAPQASVHGSTALYVDRNTGTKYRLNLGKKK